MIYRIYTFGAISTFEVNFGYFLVLIFSIFCGFLDLTFFWKVAWGNRLQQMKGYHLGYE